MIPGERIAWIDVARGLAIILVAIYHSALLLLQGHLVPLWWGPLNEALATIRMPLFFLVSGIVAAPAMRRGWTSLWQRRLALLAWTFLLWTVIRFVYFTVVPLPTRPDEGDVMRLLEAPIAPATGLWFLHALFFFLVVSRLCYERVPLWIQLAGAAVLSAVVSSLYEVPSLSYQGMARYYVFFLLGVHSSRILMQRVSARRWWVLPCLAIVYVGMTAASRQLGADRIPGVVLVLSVVAVAAGLQLAVTLAGTPLRRPLSYLGRSTLPIYVAHVLFIAAMTDILLSVDAASWLRPVLPLIVATIAVTLALTLRWILVAMGLSVAYEPPSWMIARRRIRPRQLAAARHDGEHDFSAQPPRLSSASPETSEDERVRGLP